MMLSAIMFNKLPIFRTSYGTEEENILAVGYARKNIVAKVTILESWI